jgi:hypothetical protein
MFIIASKDYTFLKSVWRITMEVKNIIISLSSVLIISAALPAVAHQEATTGIHHKENVAAPTAHEHKLSDTGTHYMMHSGEGHQGHLMEGAKHGKNQATEHQKEIITHSHPASKNQYIMHGGEGHQGHLTGDKDHTNQ